MFIYIFELNELTDTNEGMYLVVIKHLNTIYLKMLYVFNIWSQLLH